jgi:transcriptional regulator with PAS, ATPase and Fis domain
MHGRNIVGKSNLRMTITDLEIQNIKQRFGIIGNSPLLNNAVRVAMQVAPTDMSVLITGESGSGKESFSKIIHHTSPRKHGQFIAINCGSIPEGTIDSELFGHEKGSFTGAHEARKGYFEVTNGGTIFLDEIGEMPLGTQARLLRVLENGEFIKVGSSKVQKTDVRVVAATNVNLMKNVEDGKFREDLYYRLSTVPIFVPPLRERGRDAELLFRKFATDFAEKYKVKPISLTDDAKEALLKYRFPGNIRQLKNLVEQISVLSTDNKEITTEILSRYLPKENNLPALYRGPNGEKDSISERDILYKVLFDMKKDVTDLKKIVLDLLNGQGQGGQLVKDNAHLFQDIHAATPELANESVVLNIPAASQPMSNGDHVEDVHDITHEAEDDSLSIEKKEKELIMRALRKNNNRRKYAARDLGISERTLYRKIKQYELEE